jgi:hypothetical protein
LAGTDPFNPTTAPFLNGADIFVAADCTPVAYPDFLNLLQGKVVMMGCPKFDDAQEYLGKFADIFRSSDIRSVIVLEMEVPCCAALPVIVKREMNNAGENIPIEEIVVSTQGRILRKRQYAE